MSITLAIIGFFTALVPVLIWWISRKSAPTPSEQRDDTANDFAAIRAQIEKLERDGDLAGADALRRQLLTRYAPKRDIDGGSAGKQLPGTTAGGNGDHPAG